MKPAKGSRGAFAFIMACTAAVLLYALGVPTLPAAVAFAVVGWGLYVLQG
jgi:hypothetical protein